MTVKQKPPKNHTFMAGRQGGVALKTTDLNGTSVYAASTKCKDTALTKYKLEFFYKRPIFNDGFNSVILYYTQIDFFTHTFSHPFYTYTHVSIQVTTGGTQRQVFHRIFELSCISTSFLFPLSNDNGESFRTMSKDTISCSTP